MEVFVASLQMFGEGRILGENPCLFSSPFRFYSGLSFYFGSKVCSFFGLVCLLSGLSFFAKLLSKKFEFRNRLRHVTVNGSLSSLTSLSAAFVYVRLSVDP